MGKGVSLVSERSKDMWIPHGQIIISSWDRITLSIKLLVMENHLEAISKETALTWRWVPLKNCSKCKIQGMRSHVENDHGVDLGGSCESNSSKFKEENSNQFLMHFI